MAEIKQKLITPSVPNFIMIQAPPGLRQDGFQESPKVFIGDLPDETLIEIANDWKDELMLRAKEQRQRKVQG